MTDHTSNDQPSGSHPYDRLDPDTIIDAVESAAESYPQRQEKAEQQKKQSSNRK